MAWTLPKLERSNKNVSVAPKVIRTQFETGPVRVRRISSKDDISVTGSVVLTSAQLAQYWTFFEGEANHGADWFQMPMITTGTVQTHTVRIQSHSIVPIGLGHHRVSLNLEVRDRV